MLRMTPALVALLVIVHTCYGARVFESFRLLQYRQDTVYGSLRSGFSLPAATPNAATLFRHAVLLPAEKLCIQDAAQYLSVLIDDQRAEAVVVLLPEAGRSWSDSVAERCAQFWPVFEREVVTRTYEVAVYFVHRDEQLNDIFARVAGADSPSLLSEKYYFEVALADAVPLKDSKVVNIQGTVPGAAGAKKTIAIVAHYDTFSIAPGAATNGGSGAIALLQLTRMLNDLATARAMPSPYTLTFVLTGAGHESFAGAQAWLDALDTPTLESLVFVLCLGELNGDALWFHTSRAVSNDDPTALLQSFQHVATKMGVPFQLTTNAKSAALSWEHEVFMRKKLQASTLSDSPTPSLSLAPSPLVPGSSPSSLTRNIQLIAEAIGRHIYGVSSDDVQVFGDDDLVRNGGSVFVHSWADAFAAVPRVTPYLKSNDAILSGMEKAMAASTLDTFRSTYPFSFNATFFGNTNAELRAYRSKPTSFDIVLSLCVVAYCAALYVVMAGPRRAVATIKEVFSASSAKRK